jgi:hypothetical protein
MVRWLMAHWSNVHSKDLHWNDARRSSFHRIMFGCCYCGSVTAQTPAVGRVRVVVGWVTAPAELTSKALN